MPFVSLIKRTLPAALPVMLGYVVIGIPAGILEAQMGLNAPMAFFLSATYYSGAGQFMLANMWIAGQSPLSIALSISLVNLRQLLYSASLAPRLATTPAPLKALCTATVTDESFGVNTSRFAQDPTWSAADATLTNILSMLAWATANALGAIAGDILPISTAVASFAMTSIFICLLLTQTFTTPILLVVTVSALVVIGCKLAGLGSMAIVTGALAGVAAGVILDIHQNPSAAEKPAPSYQDANHPSHTPDAPSTPGGDRQ